MTLNHWNRPNNFGFYLALGYALLAWVSRSPQSLSFAAFAGLMGLMFAFYALAYLSTNPTKIISGKTVFIWAVIFRLLGLLGEPIFEDDYFRYLWDGYRFATDGTPYGKPPEAFFNDTSVPKAYQAILSQINHPDIPTIYAPIFQYVFLLAHWIAAGQLWALKLLLIAVDLLLIAGLFRVAGPQRTLLYAWNPLVIKEIAFTAHPDGLIPALLIGSWLLSSQGKQCVAGLLLAMAVASKVSAWLLVPFLLLNIGSIGAGAFAGCYLLLYLPFWLQGSTDASGLAVFTQEFEFNSALYGLMKLWLPAHWAKILLGMAFISLAAVYFLNYWRQGKRSLPHGEWLFGGLLLVSPVINPWYLLWLLPFACRYFSITIWVASATVLLSYATGLNLEGSALAPYEHPAWVRPVEFGIIGLAFAFDLFDKIRFRYLHQLAFLAK